MVALTFPRKLDTPGCCEPNFVPYDCMAALALYFHIFWIFWRSVLPRTQCSSRAEQMVALHFCIVTKQIRTRNELIMDLSSTIMAIHHQFRPIDSVSLSPTRNWTKRKRDGHPHKNCFRPNQNQITHRHIASQRIYILELWNFLLDRSCPSPAF